MQPLPLYIRVSHQAHHDDDTLEHRVFLHVFGDAVAGVAGTVISDACDHPRIEQAFYNGLALPEEAAKRLLVKAWQALVCEMNDQNGSEIEWTLPDALPWLTRCMDAPAAHQVAAALARFVQEDMPLPQAVLCTTIE